MTDEETLVYAGCAHQKELGWGWPTNIRLTRFMCTPVQLRILDLQCKIEYDYKLYKTIKRRLNRIVQVQTLLIKETSNLCACSQLLEELLKDCEILGDDLRSLDDIYKLINTHMEYLQLAAKSRSISDWSVYYTYFEPTVAEFFKRLFDELRFIHTPPYQVTPPVFISKCFIHSLGAPCPVCGHLYEDKGYAWLKARRAKLAASVKTLADAVAPDEPVDIPLEQLQDHEQEKVEKIKDE